MKTFKLEIWQDSLELMGSVLNKDDASISSLRINANEYKNGDKQMIRKAFDYANKLLKSSFQNVDIKNNSSSVEFDPNTGKTPDQVVTADKINNYLQGEGYIRIF